MPNKISTVALSTKQCTFFWGKVKTRNSVELTVKTWRPTESANSFSILSAHFATRLVSILGFLGSGTLNSQKSCTCCLPLLLPLPLLSFESLVSCKEKLTRQNKAMVHPSNESATHFLQAHACNAPMHACISGLQCQPLMFSSSYGQELQANEC